MDEEVSFAVETVPALRYSDFVRSVHPDEALLARQIRMFSAKDFGET